MQPTASDHTRPTLGQYIQIYNIRKKIQERKKSKEKGHPLTFQTENQARMAGTHRLMDHHMNDTKTELEDILMNTGMNKEKLFFAVAKKLDELMVKLKTDITQMYKEVQKQYMIENQEHHSHINPVTVKYFQEKVQKSSEEKKKTNLNEVIKDNFKKAEKTQQLVNLIFGKSQDKNEQINEVQQPETVEAPAAVLSAKQAKKAKRLAKTKSISQDTEGLIKVKSDVALVIKQNKDIIKPIQIINQQNINSQQHKNNGVNNQPVESPYKKIQIQITNVKNKNNNILPANNTITISKNESPHKAQINKNNDKPVTQQQNNKLAVPQPANRPNSFMDVIFSLSSTPAPQLSQKQNKKYNQLVSQNQAINAKNKSKSPQKPKDNQKIQLPKQVKPVSKQDHLSGEISPSKKSGVGLLKRNQIKNDIQTPNKKILIKQKSPKT